MKSISDRLNEMVDRLNIDSIASLSNVYIIVNNRLVELKHEFKRSGINPEESELFFAIENSFHTLEMSAMADEMLYIVSAKSLLSLEIGRNIFDQFALLFNKKTIQKREMLRDAKRISYSLHEGTADFIFKFDIEKDLNTLFKKVEIYDIIGEIMPKSIEFVVNPNKKEEERFIHNCNVDLKKLGYDVRIPSNNNMNLNEKMETLFQYDKSLVWEIFERLNHFKIKLRNCPLLKSVILESFRNDLSDTVPNIIKAIKEGRSEDIEEIKATISDPCDPSYAMTAVHNHIEKTKDYQIMEDLIRELGEYKEEFFERPSEKQKVKTRK